MGIPGRVKVRFYQRKWIVELFSIIPPIIAAAVTAWINYLDPTKKNLAWVLIGGIIWLLVASTLKVLNAYQQDREAKQELGFDGLIGSIHVLYGSISNALNFQEKDDGRLRVTLHRVDAEELEQLLPYIGGEGGDPGRTFSVRSGIIGKVVRERKAIAASRENDDYSAFIQELVAKWAYTEADARKLKEDRMSWMAVPILGKNKAVLAVVYLDSSERAFFSDSVKNTVIDSCSGIASYISERYK